MTVTSSIDPSTFTANDPTELILHKHSYHRVHHQPNTGYQSDLHQQPRRLSGSVYHTSYPQHSPAQRISHVTSIPGDTTPRRLSDDQPTVGLQPGTKETSSKLNSVPAAQPSTASTLNPSPRSTNHQNLNYPLPLTPSQSLAAIAIMQERQESWTRAAQSSSSVSAASSPASSTSPVNHLAPMSGTGIQRKTSLNTGASEGRSSSTGKGGRPRKKVAKACLACQKSHLTCDERECSSCQIDRL